MRRFIARRERPKDYMQRQWHQPDSGRKGVAGVAWNLGENDITREATNLRIDWRFSPPAGPHFGGVWERPIQSAKRALYAVLKDRITTDETLSTLMAEVEAFLNARPLTHISVDPTDPEQITLPLPARPRSPHIPPDIFEEGELASRKDWRAAQHLAEEILRRWIREHVPRLITREQWTQKAKPLKENHIALIADGNFPRGQWTMCRVIKPIPGKDGVIRQTDVKTAGGKIHRWPAVKLVVLETSQNDEEETAHSGVARASDVANWAISEENRQSRPFFDDLLNLLTYLTKTETYLDLLQRSVGKEGCDRTVPYSQVRGFECFYTPINVLCHSLSKFPRKFACYLNVSTEDCVVPRKQISYLFGNKSSWQNELKFKRLKQLAQSERNNARQYCNKYTSDC